MIAKNQSWYASHRSEDCQDLQFKFLIVAKIKFDDETYWIGCKLGVDHPKSLCPTVFDNNGYEPPGDGYYLTDKIE